MGVSQCVCGQGWPCPQAFIDISICLWNNIFVVLCLRVQFVRRGGVWGVVFWLMLIYWISYIFISLTHRSGSPHESLFSVMIETTLRCFRLTSQGGDLSFLIVCVWLHASLNESRSQWVSWNHHTCNESVQHNPNPPPQWKAPASYLSDIILITKTYGSTGRGLCSIKSVLTGSVPEQHNTVTHPLRLGVITAMFSVCTVHSWQKTPYIFKMLIKRLGASLDHCDIWLWI